MQIWMDNLCLDDCNKDVVFIMMLFLGISFVCNSGMLWGSLDYLFNGIVYLKFDVLVCVQNLFFVIGQVELVSQMFFVDMYVSIGQQNVLVFGL